MEQTLKIKCPHCGWVRSWDVQANEDVGEATIVRNLGEDFKQVMEKFKQWASGSGLEAANAWVDMTCPNPDCRKPYRYNVQSREVKP